MNLFSFVDFGEYFLGAPVLYGLNLGPHQDRVLGRVERTRRQSGHSALHAE